MIRNISQLNKISKEILSIGPSDKPILTVKHNMSLNKTNTINKTKISHVFEYYQKSEYKPETDVINTIFRKNNDYIYLESRVNTDINSPYGEFMKCRIYYKDFVSVLNKLNEVVEWFKLSDLFTRDPVSNQIVDVKYKDLIGLIYFRGGNGRFLSFSPSIVYDNQLVYPGVQLKTNKGNLANITYDEFLTLKLCLDEYMTHFNLFSMELLNLTYLHSIGTPNDSNPINF